MTSPRHGTVVQKVLLHATLKGWRLFKNVVGGGWVGKLTEEYFTTVNHRSEKKIRIIEMMDARMVKFGVLVPSLDPRKTHGGSLDLIGWRTVKITPDMVGKRIAQYMEFDAKTLIYSRMSPDQKNRVKQIKNAGGVTGLFRMTKTGDLQLEEMSDWDVWDQHDDEVKLEEV